MKKKGRKPAPKDGVFYATFGYGQPNQGMYLVVTAPCQATAQMYMHKRFGNQWSRIYTAEMWFKDHVGGQAEIYGLKELK